MTKANQYPMRADKWVRAVEQCIPNADIQYDNYGQLVIYTGLAEDDDGYVVEWMPDDEDEED